MNIHPDRLAETFLPSLPPCYIISGDETLLVNEAADAIRSAAKQQGFIEREVFYAKEKDFDWSPVLQALNSMSLFSEKKIIEIHSSKSNLSADDFLQYWQRPNADMVVLVLVEKLDKSTLKTKWFTALEKISQFVQIWPLDGAQLNRWLSQRAKRQGLQLDNRCIQILQERTEGNLLASAQELEKLQLLFGNDAITPEKLLDAISDSTRYDIFKLAEPLLIGNARNALKILSGLLEEGTAETMILWALTKELRILDSASEALSQGQQVSGALTRQGVWDKRQPAYQQALKRLNRKSIYQLLRAAQQIDLSIKGLGPKNSTVALERLCLAFAGNGAG